MIIRSQDKYSIINFDNIDRVRLSEQRKRGEIKAHYQTDVFYDTEETFGVLGTYSTEEKAIKVFSFSYLLYPLWAIISGFFILKISYKHIRIL